MAGKYHELAGDILRLVGGNDNVVSLAHCITRLRFKLKDESIANNESIGALGGVIQVMQAGGQYQVVVGSKVDEVYDELLKEYGVAGAGEVPEDDDQIEQDKNPLNMLMNVISGTMGPVLMVLAAAGMSKGIAALLMSLGLATPADGIYQLLYAAGDAFFYFLPIMLGFSAAKKFGCSEFVGAAIGAALVYPTMVNLPSTTEALGTVLAGTPFASSYYSTFLGIPILLPKAGYPSSVVPILFAVWAAAKMERWFRGALPEVLRGFFAPFFTLLLGTLLTYLVIGPLASIATGILSLVVNGVFALPVVGGALGGAVLGAMWPLAVTFGLHWAVIPMILNDLAQLGYSHIPFATNMCVFVNMAMGLAICLKTRDVKTRSLAIPGTISQICGIGEPLMYAVFIPRKKYFYMSMVFSAIGGLVGGMLQGSLHMMGGLGIFSLANFIDPATGDLTDMVKFVCCAGAAMVAAFAYTFLTWKDDEAKTA